MGGESQGAGGAGPSGALSLTKPGNWWFPGAGWGNVPPLADLADRLPGRPVGKTMHRHSHAAHRATLSPRAAKRIPVFKILVLALLVAGLVAVLAFSEFDWKSVPDLLEEVNR